MNMTSSVATVTTAAPMAALPKSALREGDRPEVDEGIEDASEDADDGPGALAGGGDEHGAQNHINGDQRNVERQNAQQGGDVLQIPWDS